MQGVDFRTYAEAHDIELIVLFGSAARGRREARDLDLAVWPRTPRSSLKLAEELLPVIPRGELDVVSLPLAGWLLWQEVTRDGQPLYECRPHRFRQFQLEATCRSWDVHLWRRHKRRCIQQILTGVDELNEDLVNDCVISLRDYLGKLERLVGRPEADFCGDFAVYHAAERLLELLVEQAGRLNAEVSLARAGTPATDYYSSFFSLASVGWISSEQAQALGQSARLRETLVHRYEELTPVEVYQQLARSLPFWRKYLSVFRGR